MAEWLESMKSIVCTGGITIKAIWLDTVYGREY
jgi:hypothetical protein